MYGFLCILIKVARIFLQKINIGIEKPIISHWGIPLRATVYLPVISGDWFNMVFQCNFLFDSYGRMYEEF
jgi:hypothetical protein